MKAKIIGKTCEVTLSKRNLLSLLHKLKLPGSARQLRKAGVDEDDGSVVLLVVKAEEDDEHYGDTRPGPMHPLTERYIDDMGDL